MTTSFSFDDLEKKLGSDGPASRNYAENRRAGDDAKNRGVYYERSFATFQILSAAKYCIENNRDGHKILFSSRAECLVDDLLIKTPRGTWLYEVKYRKRLAWRDVLRPFNIQLRWNMLFPAGTKIRLALVVPTSEQQTALVSKTPPEMASVNVRLFECGDHKHDTLRHFFFVEHFDASTLENLADYVEDAWVRLNFEASVRTIMKAAGEKARHKIRSLEPNFVLDQDTKDILKGIKDLKTRIMGDGLHYSHRTEDIGFWLPYACGSESWEKLVALLKDAKTRPKTFLEFTKCVRIRHVRPLSAR
ncbi:hypothetical protein [Rhizobium sp. F40D2]|uniref:hypothetical protein n=1 Tax=Rhizobium sp. F40D2 TaxID=3453141 RepID=UPI003F2272FC